MKVDQFIAETNAQQAYLDKVEREAENAFFKFWVNCPGTNDLPRAIETLCYSAFLTGMSQGMTDARRVYAENMPSVENLIAGAIADLKADNDRAEGKS